MYRKSTMSGREALERLARMIERRIEELKGCDVDWAHGYVTALREVLNEDVRDLLTLEG